MWSSSAMARSLRRGALTVLLAGAWLPPGVALAAGREVKAPNPTAAAAAKPSEGSAQLKISPYVRASRERARARRLEHEPKLRLSVRGAQKASGR